MTSTKLGWITMMNLAHGSKKWMLQAMNCFTHVLLFGPILVGTLKVKSCWLILGDGIAHSWKSIYTVLCLLLTTNGKRCFSQVVVHQECRFANMLSLNAWKVWMILIRKWRFFQEMMTQKYPKVKNVLQKSSPKKLSKKIIQKNLQEKS